MKNIQILVIDLGSQYTQVIGRMLRELGFRAAILPPDKSKKWLRANKPKAIILSGGSASVYEKKSPQPPKEILDLGVPIIGICYGMQWLVYVLQGQVARAVEKGEYGPAVISYTGQDGRLFEGMKQNGTVWASHGDSIIEVPNDFSILAMTNNGGTIAAIGNADRKIWGVQFHPEVTHTVGGENVFENFLSGICGCEKDWSPGDVIKEIHEEVAANVGAENAVVAYSGGVDSTLLATIVQMVLAGRVLAVSIDTGALRKGEISEIRKNAEAAGIKLVIVEAEGRFLEALRGVTDAEEKRKVFKRLYVEILEEEAEKFGASIIIQGSLATDFIESGGVGEAALIKSHHNIGNKWRLTELHPLRRLFKYEVRALAESLGLPASVFERQPFPGPGLFLRIVGVPPTKESLDILREADSVVTGILKKHGIFQNISQLVVVLIGVKTVGIQGDGRTYCYPIVVRAVVTQDFMTVKGSHFGEAVEDEIISALTAISGINRVWFDYTDKPPATTEME